MTLEYSVRGYAGAAPATTLSSGITNSATSLTIASGTGYPTTNFALVIDPGTASEEKIFVGSRSSGSCSSCTRGVDGTSGVSHLAGAVVQHVYLAQDASEANAVASAMTTKGDLLSRNSTATAAPQRLAAGTDHKFVRARSAATLGLQYDYAPLIFASTSARDTELSSPVDGMLVVLNTGDSAEGLSHYNGTSWRKPWNMPWGVVGVAQATANQATISSIVDLTSLTVAFTAVTGRYYRTSLCVNVQQSTSASSPIIAITDGSNTVKNQWAITLAAGDFGLYTGFVYETISAGAVTRKARGSVGAGTFTVSASAGAPAQIIVEDMGPSGNPT